jgi:hypothetical protein
MSIRLNTTEIRTDNIGSHKKKRIAKGPSIITNNTNVEQPLASKMCSCTGIYAQESTRIGFGT